jgi:hypothetical protein
MDEERMRAEEERLRAEEEKMHAEEQIMRISEEVGDFGGEFDDDPFFSENKIGPVKSISIRGVNAEIYDQFANKIKTLDITIGDAISKLMKDVNASFDKEFPEISAKSLKLLTLGKLSISHHRDLVIAKKDLLETERAINFTHCTNLRFEPDIDKATFLEHVKGIMHCKGVQIPKVLPKLLLLSRIRFCNEVEFYEVD